MNCVNCSDCSNIFCDCFTQFVQNISKKETPKTSASINLLNKLFTLVTEMQYNVFSDYYLHEIIKESKETFYVNTEVDVSKLEETIMQKINYIAEKIDRTNIEVFMNNLIQQLFKTTFVCGIPNNEILYYEEIVYFEYNRYNLVSFASGSYYKECMFVSSSGYKNNSFNIVYTLLALIKLRTNFRIQYDLQDIIRTVFKIFIYFKLLLFDSKLSKIKVLLNGKKFSILDIDYYLLYSEIEKLDKLHDKPFVLIGDKELKIINDSSYGLKANITSFKAILRENHLKIEEFFSDYMMLLSHFKYRDDDLPSLIGLIYEESFHETRLDKDEFKTKMLDLLVLPDRLDIVSRGLFPISFIENISYIGNMHSFQSDKSLIENQYIPFKKNPTKNNNGSLVCHNGSLCAEPKLFNYLLDNRIIDKDDNHQFACFWHGELVQSSVMYVPQNTSDVQKKLFLLGYYYYLVKDNNIRCESFVNDKFNPVFNRVMLPCAGCQINSADILSNKIKERGYNWNALNCDDERLDVKQRLTPNSSPIGYGNTRKYRSKNQRKKSKKRKIKRH